MSVIAVDNSAAAIWQRTIKPLEPYLDPGAARALLRLRFSRADLDRADELAAKAQEGELTSSEQRELETYLAVGSALEFLKSKARQSLKHSRR